MKNANYFQLFIRSKKYYKTKIAQMKLAMYDLANERNELQRRNTSLLEQIRLLNELICKKDASFDKLLSMLEYMTERVNENKQYHKE